MGAHLQREGREGAGESEAHPEEVADRGLDRRGRLAVPVHPQRHVAAHLDAVGERRHRDPEVLHAARAVDLAEGVGVAGTDEQGVDVAAGAVVGRETVALEVAELRQPGERAPPELEPGHESSRRVWRQTKAAITNCIGRRIQLRASVTSPSWRSNLPSSPGRMSTRLIAMSMFAG